MYSRNSRKCQSVPFHSRLTSANEKYHLVATELILKPYLAWLRVGVSLWPCRFKRSERSERSARAERRDLEHCAHDQEQQDHRPHQDPKDLQGETCCVLTHTVFPVFPVSYGCFHTRSLVQLVLPREGKWTSVVQVLFLNRASPKIHAVGHNTPLLAPLHLDTSGKMSTLTCWCA